jgi:Alpha-glutamyl/putrescinyl thymine pyrophosphorylase clade 3
MWPQRAAQLAQLENGLLNFSQNETHLAGAQDPVARCVLAKQMIASLRRLDYTAIIKTRDINSDRANPDSDLFDPERAALLHARGGNLDEAIWLIFLSTHFGKHGRHSWRMLRDVYSGLGDGTWTWARVSARPEAFREWLRAKNGFIRGAFGNHRKYETLNPDSRSSTAIVVESFVHLCHPSPRGYFNALTHATGNDPKEIFDAAYRGLTIARFGRLAKFDFLALLGRLDLAPVKPGSAYLRGATGPLRGVRLLVDGDAGSRTSADQLDGVLQRLDLILDVGMQVMEDSICNWQKSPKRFVHFRG